MSCLSTSGRRLPAIYASRSMAGTLSALLLTVFAGCASTPATQEGQQRTEPVISRLDGDTRGFVIEERGAASAETRSAFADAVALLEQEQYQEAIMLLQQVIAAAPELTAPHIDIALAYEHRGDAEKAEEHLQQALQLVPGHPLASNAYGLLLRKNGRFDEARKIFTLSLERFPEYLPTRKNLGILCELYLNDPASALEQYEIYSEATPDDEQVKIWMASLRQRLEGAP